MCVQAGFVWGDDGPNLTRLELHTHLSLFLSKTMTWRRQGFGKSCLKFQPGRIWIQRGYLELALCGCGLEAGGEWVGKKGKGKENYSNKNKELNFIMCVCALLDHILAVSKLKMKRNQMRIFYLFPIWRLSSLWQSGSYLCPRVRKTDGSSTRNLLGVEI